MAEVAASYVPYWDLKDGWWPILVFSLTILQGTIQMVMRISVDLLYMKCLEESSIVGFDEAELEPTSSYVDEEINGFVLAGLFMGIMALAPLLSSAEAFIRGGISNLTGAQAALILVALGLAVIIGLGAFAFIECLR